MVGKTKTSRKSTRKPSNRLTHVVTASFSYGPFRAKSDAVATRSRISSYGNVVTSAVKKGVRGYSFVSKVRIGATSESMKQKIITAIHTRSPNAKVSVKRV